MLITENVGSYIYTHSDTFYIRRVSTGYVCMGACDIEPTEYEETDVLLEPNVSELKEALFILGVQT